MARKLTSRQKKFIEVYSGNGTDAARKAGYNGNDNVLAQMAKYLLSNSQIKEAIDKRSKSEIAPAVEYRKFLQDFWLDLMANAAADRDRLKASELLGKSQAIFIEKHEHSGKVVLEDLIAGSHSQGD